MYKASINTPSVNTPSTVGSANSYSTSSTPYESSRTSSPVMISAPGSNAHSGHNSGASTPNSDDYNSEDDTRVTVNQNYGSGPVDYASISAREHARQIRERLYSDSDVEIESSESEGHSPYNLSSDDDRSTITGSGASTPSSTGAYSSGSDSESEEIYHPLPRSRNR